MTIYAVQRCEAHDGTTLRSLWTTYAEAAARAEGAAAGMTREDCVFGSYEVWEFYPDDDACGEYLSSHYGPYPHAAVKQ